MSIASLLWLMAVVLTQQPASSSATTASLNFDYFKARVQPIFLAKRPGHARCYACHSQGTPMRLQPLSVGTSTWNEEESQKNFEAVRRMVIPGDPLKSPRLRHPLALEAGGDLFHNGGKHWNSQSDQEWQTLLAWASGKTTGGTAR